MQKSFRFAHIPLLFFFFSSTFEGETAYLSVQNGWVSNARCKLLVFNRVETENYPRECRDARLMRPLQQSCIYAFNSTWTDARLVRPYMQYQPYHNAISAISSYDITHFARWNGPFLCLNRVISHGQTMHFVSRNGPFVIITLSFLSRIRSKNDRHFMLVYTTVWLSMCCKNSSKCAYFGHGLFSFWIRKLCEATCKGISCNVSSNPKRVIKCARLTALIRYAPLVPDACIPEVGRNGLCVSVYPKRFGMPDGPDWGAEE